MPEKIDLTRVYPRTYKCQFRFIIDAPPDQKNKSSYYHHYMSRWSRFISQVMAIRLSKTEVRDILPEIRNILPVDVVEGGPNSGHSAAAEGRLPGTGQSKG